MRAFPSVTNCSLLFTENKVNLFTCRNNKYFNRIRVILINFVQLESVKKNKKLSQQLCIKSANVQHT